MQWLSSSAECPDSPPPDLGGSTAYQILDVPETSSFSEIKSSFRKLAKETHPDIAGLKNNDPGASPRFVRILAAYEILSNSEKRAHYDVYLLSQRANSQKHSRQVSTYYWRHESHLKITRQMEVVDWLKSYRHAIKEILSEKHVVVGSGYFDALEGDFYSAIHKAYFGPEIVSMDCLPDSFEAEERSVYGTSEVLHLVSGRYLFGMVCVANKIPKLLHNCNDKLSYFTSSDCVVCRSVENVGFHVNSDILDLEEVPHTQQRSTLHHTSDAFKELELQVCGKVVAVATRVPPKSYHNAIQNEDSQDHIHVFLSSDGDPICELPNASYSGRSVGLRIPLATIVGLGTSPEEGTCCVYNKNGAKTHEIIKHRTLLVKHMHWYRVGNKVSVCECRCRRARLPPSKFWLFEPRCGMHDVGGWYVETFGRDIEGRNVLSKRYWDGFGLNEEPEK